MERKKKLRLVQISLLIFGVAIILLTYSGKSRYSNEEIFPDVTRDEINKQLANQSQNGDVFYNIKYSGLDLSGNRYILKSKEAFSEKTTPELVNMTTVEATFYFKDDTILYVWSNKGIYNNKTLDMNFMGNVKAVYEGSDLFAEKAVYSNSKSFLTITENVKVIDARGTVFADRLLFDIKKQTLNIASFDNSKVNTNVNLK